MNKAQIKSVLSFQKKIVNSIPSYPALHKAWVDKYGKQIIADHFKVIRFKEQVDGIAQHGDNCPEGWIEKHDAVEGILADAFESSNENMLIVTESELKEHIKNPDSPRIKDTGRTFWSFGDHLPWVDANYLLDILKIVPDAKFYRPKHVHLPIYFDGTNGDGILCPIRQN